MRRKPDLFEVAGDVVGCQEDFVVTEETGGLSDHQETVVEEDQLGVQLALLRPLPDIISQHRDIFRVLFSFK